MTDPVDRNILSAHAGCDSALQRELLALFIAQADEIRTTVLTVSRVDDDALRRAAHLLLGSSSAIGASRLAAAAAACEVDLASVPARPSAGERVSLSRLIEALVEARNFAAGLARTLA